MKRLLTLLVLISMYFTGTAQRVFNLTNIQDPGAPVIAPVGSLTAFFGNPGVASAEQTFTFSATGLIGNVTFTAGSGMEVSPNGSSWAGTAVYTQTSGSASGTVHVRIAAATSVGSYSGSIDGSSPSATTTHTPTFTATVATPSLSATTSITGLNAVTGNPGATQNLVVTFANIIGNITETAPTNTEISQNGGGSYASLQSFSTGSPKTLLIRVASAAPPGAISGNAVASAANVSNANTSISGTVSTGGSNDTIRTNMWDGLISGGFIHQASWNNWNPAVQVNTNQTSAIFNYTTGVASPITATVTQNNNTSANYYDNTLAYATGNTSGFPDTAFRIPFGWFDSGPDSLIFNNVAAAANGYDLVIGSSRNTSFPRNQSVICNGASITFDAQNNINNTIRFNNIVRDGNNKIIVIFTPDPTVQTDPNNRASYFNFFMLIKKN